VGTTICLIPLRKFVGLDTRDFDLIVGSCEGQKVSVTTSFLVAKPRLRSSALFSTRDRELCVLKLIVTGAVISVQSRYCLLCILVTTACVHIGLNKATPLHDVLELHATMYSHELGCARSYVIGNTSHTARDRMVGRVVYMSRAFPY